MANPLKSNRAPLLIVTPLATTLSDVAVLVSQIELVNSVGLKSQCALDGQSIASMSAVAWRQRRRGDGFRRRQLRHRRLYRCRRVGQH